MRRRGLWQRALRDSLRMRVRGLQEAIERGATDACESGDLRLWDACCDRLRGKRADGFHRFALCALCPLSATGLVRELLSEFVHVDQCKLLDKWPVLV